MSEPHPFRRAAEAKDMEAMREALTEDVALHSPILFRGFDGIEPALIVLGHVAEVLENFAYLDEVADGSRVVLRFRADVGDLEIEGIDFLELDDDGRVRELTVFMRPLTAVNAFNERMKARFEVAPPA